MTEQTWPTIKAVLVGGPDDGDTRDALVVGTVLPLPTWPTERSAAAGGRYVLDDATRQRWIWRYRWVSNEVRDIAAD